MAERRVVVITGGGAGIGRATAERFVADGWAVALLDHSEADGRATLERLTAAGGEALLVLGDVAEESRSQAVVTRALDRWGRVDALVANAGARVFGSLLEATEADWDLILGVNLKGVAYACRAALPTMIARGSGSLVIVSSANALIGRANMPLYDATKAAVLSLTRSLAVAHGPDGVRVNAVAPGFCVTDFHERRAAAEGRTPAQLRAASAGYGLLGRPAEPAEIASVIAFLAGDDARHITGQTLLVDGGMSVGR